MLLVAATVRFNQVEGASLRLTWTDSSDDEDGFKLERSIGSTFVEIATVGANINSRTDTGLATGTTYC